MAKYKETLVWVGWTKSISGKKWQRLMKSGKNESSSASKWWYFLHRHEHCLEWPRSLTSCARMMWHFSGYSHHFKSCTSLQSHFRVAKEKRRTLFEWESGLVALRMCKLFAWVGIKCDCVTDRTRLLAWKWSVMWCFVCVCVWHVFVRCGGVNMEHEVRILYKVTFSSKRKWNCKLLYLMNGRWVREKHRESFFLNGMCKFSSFLPSNNCAVFVALAHKMQKAIPFPSAKPFSFASPFLLLLFCCHTKLIFKLNFALDCSAWQQIDSFLFCFCSMQFLMPFNVQMCDFRFVEVFSICMTRDTHFRVATHQDTFSFVKQPHTQKHTATRK